MKLLVIYLVILAIVPKGLCLKNLRAFVKENSYQIEETREEVKPIENVKIHFADGFFDEKVKEIKIEKLNFDYFPVVFGVLQNFSKVEIKNCGDINLDESFLKSPIMEHLTVNDNIYPQIRKYTFQHSDNLKSLNLERNQIQIVDKFAFFGLNNLETIFLSNNAIQKVEVGTFSCPTLKTLWLSNNKIESLDDYMFEEADQLKFLQLKSNRIENVSENAFSGLGKLEKLFLDENSIDGFVDGVFEKTPNLRELSLSENAIKVIQERLFYGLYSLNYLDLTKNDICAVSPKAFLELQNLKTLALQKNYCFKPLDNENFNLTVIAEASDLCFKIYEKLPGMTKSYIKIQKYRMEKAVEPEEVLKPKANLKTIFWMTVALLSIVYYLH